MHPAPKKGAAVRSLFRLENREWGRWQLGVLGPGPATVALRGLYHSMSTNGEEGKEKGTGRPAASTATISNTLLGQRDVLRGRVLKGALLVGW